MADPIGKLTRGYEMANKPKIKKERTHGEKEGEKREKTTLSEKKEEASNVSEQRDKGWIHVICVHTRYNPLSSHNNTAGQQTLTNYPTQKRMSGLVKHRDYPDH